VPAVTLDRPFTERFLAWLYTGPTGRLYGPLADIAALWAKWILGRARARLGSRQ
jgi:hypothetical protein